MFPVYMLIVQKLQKIWMHTTKTTKHRYGIMLMLMLHSSNGDYYGKKL